MSVARQLFKTVRLAAEGQLAADGLYSWLAENVQAIADADDADARALADQVWIALGEWQDGIRSEAEVRAALDHLLLRSHTMRAVWAVGGATPPAVITDVDNDVVHGRIQFAEPFRLTALPVGGRPAAAASS